MNNTRYSESGFTVQPRPIHDHALNTPFLLPPITYYEHNQLRRFGRRLFKAARNILMLLSYLVIAVVVPVALGLFTLFSNDAGPHCLECININGAFYANYSFWSAVLLCGVGVMMLFLGIIGISRGWWKTATSRYHMIRMR